LNDGGSLENRKFAGEYIACSGIAGDSRVKLKNIWRVLLNSRIAGVAM